MVWETFELNQLNSAPSQLLPVFPGLIGCKLVAIDLDRPISFLFLFLQMLANFFFIVMTTGQELGYLISKPVFQCSKVMKCNNEAKASHVRHSPNCYKLTTYILPKP
jgi:hypothetical protein